MSSTNINVGIFEGRNSSRVLKPPGGGHSQIFGKFEDEKPRTKTKYHNSSEINSCFIHETNIIEKKELIHVSDTKEMEMQQEQKLENVENAVPDAPVEDVKQELEPRKRIPPGGFSSGFW